MNARKLRLVITIAFLLIFSGVALAQEPPLKSITYRLSMSRPQSHLFEVAILIELPDQLKDKPLLLQMAKWSPGRYGVFDFAKNVQEFRAVAGDSSPRTVTRVDDQTWSVAPRGSSTVTISYKVFGNDLSGTFSQLDTRHANYNGASIFMYVVGHKPNPVKLDIQAPSGWKIVNGRTERAGPNRVAVSQLGHHDRYANRDRA